MRRRKTDWFSRGRDAFTEGKPCFIRDARLSGVDRAAWYEGWEHQQRLNEGRKMSALEREEILNGLAEVRKALEGEP